LHNKKEAQGFACLLSQRTMLSFRDAERAGEAEQAGSADRQRAGKRVMYPYGISCGLTIPSIPKQPTSQPNVDH
jgi:hypothetical protein